MNHVDHVSIMSKQDPRIPDYDARGWPVALTCVVRDVRADAITLREIAEALRSTNALRAQELLQITISLELGVGHADLYMTQTAGPGLPKRELGFVKPDNDHQVFFYEQDFYVLSNFSAFNIEWTVRGPAGRPTRAWFDTSECLYHWLKFCDSAPDVANAIFKTKSAHHAFKLAEENKSRRRSDWDDVKADLMREILRAKADQHEYVRRKLLATGDRELIEDSWRDPYWGWGPNRDGQNMLGKLWMEVRAELRAAEGVSQGAPAGAAA